ncbi:MAG: septum formation protein [Hyphomicrobiaceae bacterium]
MPASQILNRRLVLASGSPRRKELLAREGMQFRIDVAGTPEEMLDGEAPVDAVVRLAFEKAQAVVPRVAADEIVLAADTTVIVDGQMLGKPEDPEDAARMLRSLSGRNHTVATGWVIVGGAAGSRVATSGWSVSTVRMREISLAEARAYAAGPEPLDKAGAYAVQGEGRRFIACVLGSIDNVIGLPVAQVLRALARFGVEPAQ